MVGIYKIVNPNNKIYIGQSWAIENRIKKYEKLYCDHQRKLYNSIVKYGWENHIFSIVCELPKDVSQDIFNTYEILYFDQYKYCGFEMLNIKEPGSRGKHSKETKLRISESTKGRKWSEQSIKKSKESKLGIPRSEETKKKISTTLKGVKKPIRTEEHKLKLSNSNKGKKLSKDTKKKISNSNKGRTPWNKGLKKIDYSKFNLKK
jgi:group I intron endonuclease